MTRRSLDKFKKELINSEVGFTDSIATAMWLLPDGSMIDGEFDYNMRGQDHRVIFSGTDYGDYYESSNTNDSHWTPLHRDYRVVRLVPESMVALLKGRQRLTDTQKNILSDTSYEIERY